MLILKRVLLIVSVLSALPLVPAISQETAQAHKINTLVASKPDGFSWEMDWDAALKHASADNKLVLVDVYTDWCGWCKRLDQDTYADATVSKYLGEKFICVKANAEREPYATKVRGFNVSGFPTILILDGNGKLKGRLAGYLPPKEFNKALHEIVAKR